MPFRRTFAVLLFAGLALATAASAQANFSLAAPRLESVLPGASGLPTGIRAGFSASSVVGSG
ncbi:MAG: hypothetical protein ACRD19_00140, partial [Terriglobia bacterium]